MPIFSLLLPVPICVCPSSQFSSYLFLKQTLSAFKNWVFFFSYVLLGCQEGERLNCGHATQDSPAQPSHKQPLQEKPGFVSSPWLNHAQLRVVETACAVLSGSIFRAEAHTAFHEDCYIFSLRDCSDNKPNMEKEI